jgi:hypothetical protein
VLQKYFGYDNSSFIDALKRRGFGIAEQGRSPYMDSESNMASALNMDYLNGLSTVLGPDSHNGLIVKQLIGDSRASRFLKSLGYRYIHLDTDNTTFAGDNPHISRYAALDNLTYLWLRGSILRPFTFSQGASNERFRGSVLSTFDRLNALPGTPGPTFAVVHVMPPHDPYVFGPQGQSVTVPDPSDNAQHSRAGMKLYVDQLRFINHKLLESVDRILARSPSPPIIIIQSDEGFEGSSDVFGKQTIGDIRVKGLSAFYLPGKDVSTLPQDLNIVNSFRYLFDQYFGTRFGMLENHSYAEGDHAYQWNEIQVRGDPTPSPG